MRQLYFDIIYQHGALIACLVCLFFTIYIVFRKLKKRQIQNISTFLILLATAISIEFYSIQFKLTSATIVYPLTLIVLIIQRLTSQKFHWLFYALFVLHSFLIILGLNCLSVRANTWGDSVAPIGAFMVPNSVIIITYLGLRVNRIKFLTYALILIGILATITILVTTKEFETATTEIEEIYYSNDVINRRLNAIICALVCFINGILLSFKKHFIGNGL